MILSLLIEKIELKKKFSLVRQSSDLNEIEPLPSPEFVSDDYDTSAINIDEIQREIELLSSSSKSKKPTTGKRKSFQNKRSSNLNFRF